MRIIADASACVGAGQCAVVAGELFDQDDEGIVELLEETPGPADHAAARRAASLCPAHAITLDEG